MTPPSTRPLRLRALITVTAVAFAIAACQPAAPSPSPSARPSPSGPATPVPSATPEGSPAGPVDLSQTYATIEEQVRAIRGLDAKNPVDPVVLDDAGIKKVTADGFRRDNPEQLVKANERLLKGLGLLPADADLENLYVEMLGSQVAGLYSPDDKQLYVVSRSGNLGPTEKTTFAHEYTHALQDQNFDIKSLNLDEVGEGDRGIARLALVEGDATLTMSLWQIQNLNQADLLKLIGESLNPEVTGQLESLPAVLRESLLFPYTSGLAFVQMLQLIGWQSVNNAFSNPPASTEQILHPEKYVVGEKPVDVSLPADLAARMGPGWSVGLEDTFGEFQLRLWLDQAGSAGPVSASDAAAGWGGDRIALLDGPDGSSAIALSTVWDTPQDATDFARTASAVVTNLGNGKVTPGADGKSVTVLLASSDAALQSLGSALGG